LRRRSNVFSTCELPLSNGGYSYYNRDIVIAIAVRQDACRWACNTKGGRLARGKT
jgi:hypothetical protein